MKNSELYNLLRQVAAQQLSVEEAALIVKKAPFEELDCARIDTHRQFRQGVPEVIYGEGKTAEQILSITQGLQEAGQRSVLITRLSEEKASFLDKHLSME